MNLDRPAANCYCCTQRYRTFDLWHEKLLCVPLSSVTADEDVFILLGSDVSEMNQTVRNNPGL